MAELRSAVDKPPMRSEIQPQIWRLSNPTPSRTDSMAAPTVADMPRSLHSATRCACGIDIVTQHRNAASERTPNTTLAVHPSTAGVAPAQVCDLHVAGRAGGGPRRVKHG